MGIFFRSQIFQKIKTACFDLFLLLMDYNNKGLYFEAFSIHRDDQNVEKITKTCQNGPFSGNLAKIDPKN